jgi:CheY-like chemotaxis protein
MPALKKFLLVEDDPVDAKIFKRALNTFAEGKYQFEHKVNGKEAYEYIKSSPGSERPDLIFLDINMPVMNGIEFLQKIKFDDELKKIPVVILTTSDDIHDRERCFSLSAAGYFTKKSDLDEFEKMLTTISRYWEENMLPID